MKYVVKVNLFTAAALLVTAGAYGYVGMSTPKLRVNGRWLETYNGQKVRLLGGWMQPTASWFNGNRWYSDPTDWLNKSQIQPMLDYMKEVANVFSDTSAKYGRSYGWYMTFVRMNTDSIGGWTHENGLVNRAQFDGWLTNFIVPYAQHLKSRGLYLIICATGPINTPNNGTRNCGVVEQQRLRTFWKIVASTPGIKSADNIHFELMNEPVDIESSPGNGDWGNHADKYYKAFRDWIQPIIDDVRSTGADNIIWVPTLEWQGTPMQWVSYPFSGNNIGIACHFYPAYGGVFDNPTAVENLWNSQYKPAADRWPLVITECFWFPQGSSSDLCNGSTAKFGNALRKCIDLSGNVSWLIGFVGDLLYDLSQSRPSSCTLSSKEGAQAAFDWWYEYNGTMPKSGNTYKIIACHSGKAMDAYGAQTANGTQIIQWTYHGGNNQRWILTDRGNGQWSITGVQSGRCVDISGQGTANGTKVQLWDYWGGNNQKYFLFSTAGAYYRISPVHCFESCLDVEGISTADGAKVQLWQWWRGDNQRWGFLTP